jgi:hypothetical protein
MSRGNSALKVTVEIAKIELVRMLNLARSSTVRERLKEPPVGSEIERETVLSSQAVGGQSDL